MLIFQLTLNNVQPLLIFASYVSSTGNTIGTMAVPVYISHREVLSGDPTLGRGSASLGVHLNRRFLELLEIQKHRDSSLSFVSIIINHIAEG